MRAIRQLMAGVAVVLASGAAQAALFDRGGGMIYDDVLNITWLQDANYARTSGYDADGLMNWGAANTWAANLVYGGYSDWRLPTVGSVGPAFDIAFSNNGSTDSGYGNTSTHSEMAYMYYVNLANLGYCIPNGGGSSGSCYVASDWGLVDDPANANDESLFSNLEDGVYWSGTDFAPYPVRDAWYFNNHGGYQGWYEKSYEFYAWAVRPGDVRNDVPEPGSLMLAALGVCALGLTRRRFGA